MPFELLQVLHELSGFGLVLFRLSGLFLTAPLFSSSVIPVRLKVALMIGFGVLLFPIVRANVPAGASLSTLMTGALVEFGIGALIGISFTFLVVSAETAGLIAGQQSGLALGEVFNPALDEQTSITAQVYSGTVLTVFLLAGGLRQIVAALLDSFAAIPLLTPISADSAASLAVDVLASGFSLGVRLAAPLLLALFLAETGLALISRTIPQLNILTIGFAIRALLGLGVAAIVLGTCSDFLTRALWDGVATIRAGLGIPAR